MKKRKFEGGGKTDLYSRAKGFLRLQGIEDTPALDELTEKRKKSTYIPRPRLSPEVVEAARQRWLAEQEKKEAGPIESAGQRAQSIMRADTKREPGPIATAGARAQNIMRASSSRRPEEEVERRKPQEETEEPAMVLFDSGLKSGGSVSRKIDGIAKRGKTRGRIC